LKLIDYNSVVDFGARLIKGTNAPTVEQIASFDCDT